MRFIVPDFHQDGKLTLDACLPGMYDGVIQSTLVNITPRLQDARMIPSELTSEEQQILLKIARQSLVASVHRRSLLPLELASLPARLQELGATFVTLTIAGQLRGCIGALEAQLPLAEDVREHAIAAALHDFRFNPVQPEELAHIEIEISRLTAPAPLQYNGPQDLIARLRPGVDGVVLRDGLRKSTFLPQVWEKLPDPAEFLSHLCQKMGAPADLWQHKPLEVSIYQVEEFHERARRPPK